MLFHSSPASLSFSHFIVIQDTSSVLYRRRHKNFYPFPHLFILLDFFPHSSFLCPAFFLFFLVNCVFHWGMSPPLIFSFSPPLSLVHHYLRGSPFISLKFQWSMANRIHSPNYTPEEPPPPSALLLLSSNHCCSLIPSPPLLHLPPLVASFFLHTYCTYALSCMSYLLSGLYHLSLSRRGLRSLLTQPVHLFLPCL